MTAYDWRVAIITYNSPGSYPYTNRSPRLDFLCATDNSPLMPVAE